MPTCGTLVRLSAVNGANNLFPASDSDGMKQMISQWIDRLHKSAPDTIGDLLHFQVVDCDARTGSCTISAQTEPWMRNAFGSLHGGIITTAMDQGMGMLATCMMDGKAITPTVQLNTTYHRPIQPGHQLFLKFTPEARTKNLIHMRAEVCDAQSPALLCASATGMFFVKEIPEPSA